MKVLTENLTDLALDWAVELANGTHWSSNGYFVFKNADGTTRTFERSPEWRYSTSWTQAGPIIDREKICLKALFFKDGGWRAHKHSLRYDDRLADYIYGDEIMQDGPTPLVAAMRCYVASKLGDKIEIPDELVYTYPINTRSNK
jgi:hypothetical protein